MDNSLFYYNDKLIALLVVIMLWGFVFGIVLLGVSRGFGKVDGTFSCGFEEFQHIVSWDSVLLMLSFLIFEFEIIFLVLILVDFAMVVFLLIVVIMGYELIGNGFSY